MNVHHSDTGLRTPRAIIHMLRKHAEDKSDQIICSDAYFFQDWGKPLDQYRGIGIVVSILY